MTLCVIAIISEAYLCFVSYTFYSRAFRLFLGLFTRDNLRVPQYYVFDRAQRPSYFFTTNQDRVIKLATRDFGPHFAISLIDWVRLKKRDALDLEQSFYLWLEVRPCHNQRSSEMSHSTHKTVINEIGKPLSNHAPVRCLYNSAVGVDVHAQLLVYCFQKYLPQTNQLLTEQAQFGTSNSQIKKFGSSRFHVKWPWL